MHRLTPALLLLALPAATRAHAQQPAASAQTRHPVSVGLAYTYLRSNILPGCNCVSLNGGSAEATVGLSPRFSAIADLTAVHRGGITPDRYTLSQVTYTLGVRAFPIRPAARLRPFGEALLGEAHTSGTLSPASTGAGPAHAFALQVGGGVTYRLTPHLLLRAVQADYVMTKLSNNADDRQNDLRLSTGLNYRFGH